MKLPERTHLKIGHTLCERKREREGGRECGCVCVQLCVCVCISALPLTALRVCECANFY